MEPIRFPFPLPLKKREKECWEGGCGIIWPRKTLKAEHQRTNPDPHVYSVTE